MAGQRALRSKIDRELLGKEKKVFVNIDLVGEAATEENPIWTPLGGETNSSDSDTAEMIDVSNKESGSYGKKRGGLKNGELSIDCIVTHKNPVLAALRDAMRKSEDVDILRWGIDGRAKRAWYAISSITEEAPVDGGLTVSISLAVNSVPVIYDDMPDPENKQNSDTIKSAVASKGTATSK